MEFVTEKRKSKSKTRDEAVEDDGERRQRMIDGSRSKDESADMAEDEDELVFEDPFGDEFEEEEIDGGEVEEAEDDEGHEDAMESGSGPPQDESTADVPKQLWRPGVDHIGEEEELEYDPSAYIMYHSMRTEWPCLSFDVLKDDMGDNRQRFPLSLYLAAGSQADRAERNQITILKLTDLHRTHIQHDSDDENDDDEDLDEDPTIEHVNIPHTGGVNRLRSMPQNPGIIATMADTRHVNIYDASALLGSMMAKSPRPAVPSRPAFTFRGHKDEGFALDWSPVVPARLATGDCAGAIHVWSGGVEASAGTWQVDTNAYRGHTGSVEDLQWSPTEGTVFASCSADRTVKIWDTRGRTGPQISINAHTSDVNVLSWNRSVGYLLASGSDDGSFKVWDLRSVRTKAEPLANFRHHTAPITSIEWAPQDESVLCLSSADNQTTIWDLSVEADDEDMGAADPALAEYPPQLLFIHQGQSNVKEIHHHPQIPGVVISTAEDGFNIFKPAITVS